MIDGASIPADHMITSRKAKTLLRCSMLCFEEQKYGAFSFEDEMNCVLASVGCEADLDVGTGQVFIQQT